MRLLSRQHIDDYIKCNFYFGKSVINNKYHNSNLDDAYQKFKLFLFQTASYEMKNGHKFALSEYRTRFTNKNTQERKTSIFGDINTFLVRLNALFEIFANNLFIGYNVPIELVVPGTQLVYKTFVDFVLSDEEGNITIVGIEDLSDVKLFQQKLKFWSHYFIPYSYMANSFDRKVNVLIIDPVCHKRIDMVIGPDRYPKDIELLNNLLMPMQTLVLTKNFHMCSICELNGSC